VNTIDQDALLGRRKRRRYTDEFKAEVVAACQGPGVSVAAIALMHKLNANLLRRWLEKAESGATTSGSDVVAMKASAAVAIPPAFVPLQINDANHHSEIRVEHGRLPALADRRYRFIQVMWRIATQKQEMAKRAEGHRHESHVLAGPTSTASKQVISNRYGVECIGQNSAVTDILAIEEVANEWSVDEH